MLRMLEEDQAEIRNGMARSREFLSGSPGADPAGVDLLRWKFDRVMTRHLHALTADLPVWLKSAGAAEVATAARIARCALALNEAYERHKARYPTSQLADHWSDYVASSAHLMDMIEGLIEAERSELFPLLRAAGA